jgi:alanine or glycine:cation symporter, AGCS family
MLILTLITGSAQFRYLGLTLREVLGKITQKGHAPGSVSPFQAVATALTSTAGVGNIAGVATAIAIGGSGALFWLWVSGVLSMCTKFAEIVIALHSRETDESGGWRGGAMYSLHKLGLPWLGTVFARSCIRYREHGGGHLGRGQPAREVRRIDTRHGRRPVAITAAVILGGIRRIGEVAEIMVPAMAPFCLVGGLAILIRYAAEFRARCGSLSRERSLAPRRLADSRGRRG